MTRLRIRERSARIREKIKWSKIYSFDVGPADPNAQQDLQGPGYSRIVHCNNPEVHHKPPLSYASNYISTTKYNFITFLPKALFEQFRRVANMYFLLTAVLTFTKVSPNEPLATVAPLALVVGLSMAKEALEDWKRFRQDVKVNSRGVSVHSGEGSFVDTSWKDVRVGDIVKVEKDDFFPADLLLLSSSYEDGICYVETMNLDGETNLKVKRSLEVTMTLEDDNAFKDFTATIKCESPNSSLYTFVGNFEYEQQVYALDPSQILLRDSKLRNTSYIYGTVIFTGHESKVMQNATDVPSKRSTIEKKMDIIIYILFALLVFISLISSIGFSVMLSRNGPDSWYLEPKATSAIFDPSNPLKSGALHFITALMLYGYLIPISLYVSIEIVKLLQAGFINQDIQMYDEEMGKPARARTSNLNEELGQVDTILTDKTGTLTCNQMDFLKCSIAGVSYGIRASEVELAAAKQIASENEDSVGPGASPVMEPRRNEKSAIKGFSFEDDRLMQGNWMNESNPDELLLFFRILALCHTAIPEQDEENGAFTYEAESPDEGAFLVAASQFGFEFCKRTQSSVVVREKYPSASELIERSRISSILNLTCRFLLSIYIVAVLLDTCFVRAESTRFSTYWNSIAKGRE